MIGIDELGASARYMDALSEEHEFEKLGELQAIDAEALQYLAEQRALRAAMLLDGIDPTRLSRTKMTKVQLSDQAAELMPMLTSLSMDGIRIGIYAGRQDS